MYMILRGLRKMRVILGYAGKSILKKKWRGELDLYVLRYFIEYFFENVIFPYGTLPPLS